MHFDIILFLLGGIVVCMFLAMFALLKTMYSPFIQRFEMVLGGKMKELDKCKDSYYIEVERNGRRVCLYQISVEVIRKGKKVHDNFMYLKVCTNSNLSIRFHDLAGKSHSNTFMEDVIGISRGVEYKHITFSETDELLKAFQVHTNNEEKAKAFLSKESVRDILFIFKKIKGVYMMVMPIIIEKGNIVLDYRLSEKFLRELVNNPRSLKKHISLLFRLSDILELIG